MWTVEKYMLEGQTVTRLQNEHPCLMNQPTINWPFKKLFEKCEGWGTLENCSYHT